MTRSKLDRLMGQASTALKKPKRIAPDVGIKVGVDLGTAFTVLFVTDEAGKPLAAVNQFADVVRDGIVWDFAGAQQVVRGLREKLEAATGREITAGAVTVPPAVLEADHRAHKYVLEGAGIECSAVVDETTAANAVLGITNGAVVDIGGGTTGVAILRDGVVVENHDQPSGGTHLSLVIAGALKIPFEQAEKKKVKPSEQPGLRSIVRPTLERIATIVAEVVQGKDIDEIHLVGGTAAFLGADEIMAEVTGIRSVVAPHPMLVTPLGVAQWSEVITGGSR